MATRTIKCEQCSDTVYLHGDTACDCGAWYNAFGQRLRDDWHRNRSNWDEDVSDMDGFEAMYANDY